MNGLLAIFDVLLTACLVGLAWMAIASRDLFRAVVLFIVFGLLLSLAWIRLQAPDIALAEAAIGAGLTGALLLNATGFPGRRGRGARDAPRNGRKSAAVVSTGDDRSSLITRALIGLLCFGGAIIASLIVAGLAGREGGGLAEQVQGRMPESGVVSAVTAVLLNFRGYDTLLEIGVLLLAVIGVSSLRKPDVSPPPREPLDNPLLAALARLLFPATILAAGYLLWSGTHAPGGAFQAGSTLGAGMVLLHLAGFRAAAGLRDGTLRALFLSGFLVFLAAAGGTVIGGGRLLEYPDRWARVLIVLIEGGLTVSIAFILVGLFVTGSPPAGGGRSGRESAQ